MKITVDERMTVAAHRGDSYNYHENTMTAFKEAYRVGADMIETDVRMTKDGALILMHDDTVNRTTNGKGKVSRLTLEEIKDLNAGDRLNTEGVPTFLEFIEWLVRTPLTVNIEIKEYFTDGNDARAAECIDKVISLVEKYLLDDRILINSFDAAVLEYVYKKYGKKYKLHGFYPYCEMFNVNIDPTEYLYCACIWDIDNSEYYDFLSKNGIEAWVGASITKKSILQICWENGAKLITTNNPADIIEKLKGLGQKWM